MFQPNERPLLNHVETSNADAVSWKCSHGFGSILFYLYAFLYATLLYTTLKGQTTEKPSGQHKQHIPKLHLLSGPTGPPRVQPKPRLHITHWSVASRGGGQCHMSPFVPGP